MLSTSHDEYLPGTDSSPYPLYSLVFIIHGDGNYLYHDTVGNEYQANVEVLAGARTVAERNPRTEVFIFHQRPARRLFGFLHRMRDGDFYHYRSGRLVANASYRREHGQSRFDPEVELYNRHRAAASEQTVRMFFYYGHEIPEIDGTGYDASYRRKSFTIGDLAGGFKEMTRETGAFDLIVLSTCYGGTPHTVSVLSPYAKYIIASPDNLHLSHFDLSPLENVNVDFQKNGVYNFAREYALWAFNRLKADVHTTVSVSLYDVARVQTYVQAVGNSYRDSLSGLKGGTSAHREFVDCIVEPDYTMPNMSAGVEIFYRPPRFGPAQINQEHSGWSCQRLLRRSDP
jgi:hypothetical protein